MWNCLRKLLAGFRRAINEPFQELNRWQRAARFAYDLGRYGARQLKQDRAPQMASALAFRTLFGLAPILVVTTILIKNIKGPDVILDTVHRILVAAGLDQLHVGSVPGDDGRIGESVTLAKWLEDLTRQLVNTDMSAVELVGLAVIIYAAIGLMVTIENSFNIIYRAPDGRAWSRRIPLYWFILTISPIMIGLTSYMNQMISVWINSLPAWNVLLVAAKYAWGFGLIWLLIVAVYSLIPNSNVKLQPACVGAFVTTLLLWLGKNTLGAYLGNVFAINQLYGSLGLVPLFMFWVYLMWLAVLFGLEVSAILQTLEGRSLDQMDPPREPIGLTDPTGVLTMIEVISEQFVRGKVITPEQLAETTAIPLRTVNQVIDRLVQEGWLHRVSPPEGAISLAQPLDQMEASVFLQLGHEMACPGDRVRTSALTQQLRDAQQRVTDGITLSMLIPAGRLSASRPASLG